MNRLAIIGLLTVLASCTTPPSASPPSTPSTMGLLKVTIEGIGEGATPKASAQWMQTEASSEVRGQSAVVLPINGTAAVDDVQLNRRAVSFYDDDSNSTRYVMATFDLVNRTMLNFNNFTLYAVNVPGNIGGTAIASLVSGAGVSIADANVARGLKPIHAVQPTINALKINEIFADLQFVTGAEAADIKQQAVAQNILSNAATVLEYGFVARNHSGSRTIAARNTGADCTINACKGTFTLAFQLPKVVPRQNNPFSFSLYFVLANEITQIGSQTLEEQAPNTVMGLVNPAGQAFPASGFSELRTLAGSSLDLADDRLKPLCGVKTAISPDLFLGQNPNSAAPSGSLDMCFGAGGKRITGVGSSLDTTSAMAVQADGKIVLAGYTDTDPTAATRFVFALLRYHSDGSLDTSFSSDGKQTTTVGNTSDLAYSLAIQSDGKIVVGGYSTSGGSGDFALVRYNPNGLLDTSFSVDGKTTTDFASGSDAATALAIQSDGKIVLAGSSYDGIGTKFALARYNPDGSLDSSFDGDGKQTSDVGLGDDRAHSVAIQSDGKIVVAGNVIFAGSYDFALARYNPDGSLDASFDSDGKLTTDFGSSHDSARSMAIQADGKIVVAGISNAAGSYDIALARYNPSGSLDTSFDTDGKLTTAIGNTGDEAYGVVIQSDGKIVVAGSSYRGGSNFALVRYNPNGSLDTSFNDNGIVTTDFANKDESALSLAIQSDGKIVLGGFSGTHPNNRFALARYHP